MPVNGIAIHNEACQEHRQDNPADTDRRLDATLACVLAGSLCAVCVEHDVDEFQAASLLDEAVCCGLLDEAWVPRHHLYLACLASIEQRERRALEERRAAITEPIGLGGALDEAKART